MTTMFAVGRTDLRRTRWQRAAAPSPLAAGQARLRIDRFALTSNNITYGAFGEAMHYWDFFPTGDAGTGCIPVWGFATVIESLRRRAWRSASASTATARWPTRSVLQPGASIGERLLRRRAAPARAARRLQPVPALQQRPALPARARGRCIALLRPLFITSFLIDDFLADNAFFGARTVLVSSASSKTAYGLGFCLARGAAQPRRAASRRPDLAGEPRVHARASAATTTCVAYDDVDAAAAGAPRGLRRHERQRRAARARSTATGSDRLAYSCSVGGTHWEALGGGKGLPGPRPCCSSRRRRSRSASPSGAPSGCSSASRGLGGFFDGSPIRQRPWLRVVAGHGREAIESTYGTARRPVAADEGRILAL